VTFFPVQDGPGIDPELIGDLLLGEPHFQPSLLEVLSQSMRLKISFLWLQ
jgi:hypothetical protein